ncbi:MAG: cytochrome b/b6 domain-containing protein [Pseudomonadota bacterium]|nr:MAG: cytochrome B [Pseudomonadota bacterium]
MAVERLTQERRLVWDLPLRAFHWLLVASIAGSWITAELGFEWMDVHFFLGYFTIGLLIFRIIWGFVGPRHARFSSFLTGPRGWIDYARSLRAKTPVYSVGHNPLGGLMVIVMLALVAVQAGTGLFVTDDIAFYGPYNPAVSGETASFLTRIHHQNFNLILLAVALHVLAILYYVFVKRQNLVAAMLTGRKPAEWVPENEAITSSQLGKALIVIAISAGAVYWLLAAAPPPPPDEFFF